MIDAIGTIGAWFDFAMCDFRLRRRTSIRTTGKRVMLD